MPSPQRLVFLDIDGVLNSYPFLERHAVEVDEEDDAYWLSMLDPDAVARLDRLLRTAQASVVLASTWRLVLPLPRLQALLETRGLQSPIVGTTAANIRHRGRAVTAYLAERPCPDYVILDDEDNQEPHRDRLVLTDPELGLTEAQVDEALALLLDTAPRAR